MKLSSTEQRLLDRHHEWQRASRSVRVGSFRIANARRARPPRKGDRQIVLVPSFVYGSGGNLLTQLALTMIPELLSKVDKHRDRVLDLGCGSGILAIACAKMGSKKVDALDISPAAIRSAKRHAALNGVDVTLMTKPNKRKRYKLVLANLPGSVLFEYASRFRALLEPEGLLYVSGFDRQQETSLVPLLYQNGLTVKDVMHTGRCKALLLESSALIAPGG